MMSPSLKKTAYRQVRYHPLTELVQNRFRSDPVLELSAIDLQLAVATDDVVIDCGANVGDVTSQLARTGATVYAFEPHPACFAILNRRFSKVKNVTCLNVGLMDRPCTMTLTTPDSHGPWDAIDVTESATFGKRASPTGDLTMSSVDVECIDLDVFIRSLGRPVRLMKVDIEGSEIEVLNRLIDTGTIDVIDLVVVETHERLSDELSESTDRLRRRLAEKDLEKKIRLDWY